MTLERDEKGRVRRAKTAPPVAIPTIPTPAIKPVETSSIVVPVSGQSFVGLDPFTQGLLESSPVIRAAPVVSDSEAVAAPVVPVVIPPNAPSNNSRSLIFGLVAVAIGVFAVLLTGRSAPVKQPEFAMQAPTLPPAPVMPDTGGWTS